MHGTLLYSKIFGCRCGYSPWRYLVAPSLSATLSTSEYTRHHLRVVVLVILISCLILATQSNAVGAPEENSSASSSKAPVSEFEAIEILEGAGIVANEYKVTIKVKTPPSKEVMDVVASLPRLRLITIQCDDVDEILRRIPDLKKVETLVVRGNVSDVGISQIQRMSTLKTLIIGGSYVTDSQLLIIRDLPSLRRLELPSTKITPDRLLAFRKAKPDVVVLGQGSDEP